jgi:N-methylhydantoinase A
MRIGIDTGGTFTDCVVFERGEVKILKVFSTPDDAARGILEGSGRLAGARTGAGPLEILHGTTVGTNSLLERRGARVALVSTAGFEDLIEIGRQARPRLYDLGAQRPPALVARDQRFGVRERTAADGSILARPSAAELARLRARLERLGAESVAICFLFSHLNPANEKRAARALAGLRLPLSVSHQILPEFREYERLSTVVINAFLAPRMGNYLRRLEAGVREARRAGVPQSQAAGRVYVMQSSGGLTTAARAAREPVRTILSGPAGGVVASTWLAGQLGIARAISFDMGGTSTDVCLIDGRPRTTHETTLGGLPVAVPVLDVHSVGAGGGSTARLDAGGALRVGPESAGARPGPISYGTGGSLPTVTDANLLLGRLDAHHFLGGEFTLNRDAAQRGFEEFLRRQEPKRGFRGVAQLAAGIVAVSSATMEKALRVISVERGYDPRGFALISFGGGGGLHAADLARALRMPKVIVPRHPGAFSALGILLSDVARDSVQSVLLSVPNEETGSSRRAAEFRRNLERRFATLELAARAELEREGFAAARAGAERRLDLRYRGQSYELSVPFRPDFRRLFHEQHERTYGYAHAGRPLELVNLRLRLTIRTP